MQDTKYFGAILEQMENGGREALLHYLLKYDLSGVDLRVFPKTDALWEQKLHSMSEVARFWHGRLIAGTLIGRHKRWERTVDTSELHGQFQEHSGLRGRSAETLFGREIKRLVPAMRMRRRWIKTTGRQIREYEFPSLGECRTCFEEATGQEIDWEE